METDQSLADDLYHIVDTYLLTVSTNTLAKTFDDFEMANSGEESSSVSVDDVRGQDAAKEEIRRVVNIWQYGEEFEKAGGKRPRGIIFFGPAGTGKSMTAK